MGLIVLHVGMSKTGSSSIQRWLGEQAAWLRERGIHPLRVVQASPIAPIELAPPRRGNAKSQYVSGLKREEPPVTRVRTLRQLVEQVSAHADRHDAIVLSNEGYEALFQDDISELRRELNELATAHTVRVAYYARPQHEWLEAAWRQWGFRHPECPSGWIQRQEPKLRYWQALRTARQEAPRVSFEVRPCRRDLLDGGDVVRDFADVFLGLQDVSPAVADGGWSNRGFPLEFAILLRDAPQGWFYSSLHDNVTLDRLKSFALACQMPESEAIAESRAILRRYSYRTFESENLELIRELGWNTKNYVSPSGFVPEEPGACGVAPLDELWRSQASEAELQVLFCALQVLLTTAQENSE